jgi:hypothetical protein
MIDKGALSIKNAFGRSYRQLSDQEFHIIEQIVRLVSLKPTIDNNLSLEARSSGDILLLGRINCFMGR